MARFFLLFLIIFHIFVISVKASETVHTLLETTNVAPTSSNAEAPAARRHGKHKQKHDTAKFLSEAPHVSPVGLSQTKDEPDHEDSNKENKLTGHQDPHIAPEGEPEAKKHHHHHRGSVLEESVAGGGVILGGLATTFLVAIFCYIRATRRKSSEPLTSSP